MCTLLQLLVSIYMQHRNICRKDCEWTKYIFHLKEKFLSWIWKDFSSHLEMIMNKLQVFRLNMEFLNSYCMQISKFEGKNKPQKVYIKYLSYSNVLAKSYFKYCKNQFIEVILNHIIIFLRCSFTHNNKTWKYT